MVTLRIEHDIFTRKLELMNGYTVVITCRCEEIFPHIIPEFMSSYILKCLVSIPESTSQTIRGLVDQNVPFQSLQGIYSVVLGKNKYYLSAILLGCIKRQQQQR